MFASSSFTGISISLSQSNKMQLKDQPSTVNCLQLRASLKSQSVLSHASNMQLQDQPSMAIVCRFQLHRNLNQPAARRDKMQQKDKPSTANRLQLPASLESQSALSQAAENAAERSAKYSNSFVASSFTGISISPQPGGMKCS